MATTQASPPASKTGSPPSMQCPCSFFPFQPESRPPGNGRRIEGRKGGDGMTAEGGAMMMFLGCWWVLPSPSSSDKGRHFVVARGRRFWL